MALNLNNLRTPGVYIDEVSLLPPSVAAVATAVPAFIGYTEKAVDENGQDLTLKPTKIFSLLDFQNYFGTSQPENDGLGLFITDTLDADDNVVNTTIEAKITAANSLTRHNLYYSMQLYFANGGGPCYIVSVGTFSADGASIQAAESNPVDPANRGLQSGLEAIKAEDEPTLIVIPELLALASTPGDFYGTYKMALDQAAELKDRFVLVDVPMLSTASSDTQKAVQDAGSFRGATATLGDNLSYGAAYYPYLDTTFDYNYLGQESSIIITHNSIASDGTESAGDHDGNALDSLSGGATNLLYEQAKQALSRVPLRLPSSPALAGIYAKVDNERGVWKAPANVSIGAITGGAIKIDNTAQDIMNIDPATGRSINANRYVSGRGNVVWGARTLAGNSNEWRYIPVRRFFNFVEESVKKATYQFVFEPNDANTWVKIRGMIENFLTLQWSLGALQGAKPEQAFFVRVGLGQTMTVDDINNGRLIVEIGMAVVRPAEFIILRFMHKLPEA